MGSPRSDGNTSYLVDVALGALEQKSIRCEKIVLADQRILPCQGHDECEDLAVCPLDDDVAPILEKVYAADGLILASPVYYEDVSGQMKVFIDRNCFNSYHGIRLAARAVGLIAVAESTGLDETIDSLRRFVSLSSTTHIKPITASGFAYRVGDAAQNEALVSSVRDLAVTLAAALTQPPDHGTSEGPRAGSD